MKIEYIIHHDPCEPGEYAYSVEFPYMPGCMTDGRTVEECHRNAREAAELWLECMMEDHPGEDPFRYDPWTWAEDAGERFEMDVDVRVPEPTLAAAF